MGKEEGGRNRQPESTDLAMDPHGDSEEPDFETAFSWEDELPKIPNLKARRRGTLSKKPERPQMPLSPQQKLLLLDTWLRSGRPARDFGARRSAGQGSGSLSRRMTRMTRVGRKPLGPALVQHLEGSERAKQRLQVILETIAGRMTIADACEELGIGEAMFFRLRTEVLAAGLARLEPRPMGRPRSTTSAEEEQLATMADRIAELEKQLLVSHVREEVAQLRAASTNDADVKKTTLSVKKALRRKQKDRARRKIKAR